MNWMDYREKLGIGFSEIQKLEMCKNRIANILPTLENEYNDNSLFHYANTVGDLYSNYPTDIERPIKIIISELKRTKTIPDFVSRYMAVVNSLDYENTTQKERISKILIITLDSSFIHFRIPLEIRFDDDGYFAFPKGVEEFDKALVSDTLTWLKDYPIAEKAWEKALKAYSSNDDPSQVADLFRKAMESFFGIFFGSKKTLENLKSEYGQFLKDHGVPSEITRNFETLLSAYTHFMNGYAKHHDKTSEVLLEYLMYQTGNIMRLLITLQQNNQQ